MRKPRELTENVWYEVRTAVNVSEPLFRLPEAKALFLGVLRETERRYGFEMRGLRLEGARLTFYIKPDDGLKLPKIMQWMKQTFSARFNVITGRLGHVWGERYDSEIMWGGPPEGAEEVDWAAVEAFAAATPIEEILTYKLSWDSPRTNGKAKSNQLSFEAAPKPASPPG
ncbi:MAG: hypothetical protein LBG27_13295 [Spirochaetaceae bacterium]|jgi:hypothetical protein|nr:hypothetical protein [Spirochaetaceae bacterium]